MKLPHFFIIFAIIFSAGSLIGVTLATGSEAQAIWTWRISAGVLSASTIMALIISGRTNP